MDEQEQVAAFLAANDLTCPPAYRLLDLAAEVGELAADATAATGYGADPDAFDVKRDELGDALFALLALCDQLDVDAGDALADSLAKYETRLAEDGSAGSDAD
ncbi:MazG nucleotide pyrophosphohydrolase domain-containing protein [Halosegnis sp.]|uniref:MazG nucleotide pyrophosphohydrolase domain-containing protein n=1 Tax=Halosegnis sp. TaxID=2864959 RepID=UPI0035D46CA8